MTQGTSQPDPLVGQSVANKYKIVRLLGEGGMGCVYLAEQQLGTSTRKVALKTLHKHLSHDASIKARFDREAGTVAALEHPNTIQVYDFGQMDDGTLYLVMEFVQGRSVADILEKDGPMPPARVENILRQVCGSLEEAHGHGIVHRDLKPDNVVLADRAGTKDWVEVLDFGIAKRSSEHDPNEAKLTQQGMVLGTPPYMSPEQFTGQPIDLRSDIYALGVMAYEMLSGKLPWEANTAWEWASKHMTEPPAPIERQPLGAHVPEKMKSAIVRALAKTKEERFNSAKEFFEAFSTGSGQIPAVDAPVPSVPSGAGRAKTEMGAPVMGAMSGGGMGTMAGPAAPSFNAPAASGNYGPPPVQAAVPAAPPRHGPEKKGSPGLVMGLAALALLLLVGAGGALLMSRKSKAPATSSIDLSSGSAAATGAASSMAHVDEPPPTIPTTQPLTPSTTTPVVPNNGGGTAPSKPSAKPVPTPTPSTKPTPTPPTPKADPPECVKARAARGKMNASTQAALDARCREAGGTP